MKKCIFLIFILFLGLTNVVSAYECESKVKFSGKIEDNIIDFSSFEVLMIPLESHDFNWEIKKSKVNSKGYFEALICEQEYYFTVLDKNNNDTTEYEKVLVNGRNREKITIGRVKGIENTNSLNYSNYFFLVLPLVFLLILLFTSRVFLKNDLKHDLSGKENDILEKS